MRRNFFLNPLSTKTFITFSSPPPSIPRCGGRSKEEILFMERVRERWRGVGGEVKP
jgi:hypothetical protein